MPRVKVLEWFPVEAICTREKAQALGGHYSVVEFDKDRPDRHFATNIDLGGLAFVFLLEPDMEFGGTRPKRFSTIEAAKAAAQADYEARIISALTATPMPEPGNWFDLKGDARLGECATDGCGGQPTLRLEAGGTGSNYCSGCAASIRALTTPPAREISEAEVERAARRSYQYEGDKRGIDYAGWDMEPEGVKEEWRASCRVALEAARSPS
jgi:hypothetical protein